MKTIQDLTKQDYINYINSRNWDAEMKEASLSQVENGTPEIRFVLCNKVVMWLNS